MSFSNGVTKERILYLKLDMSMFTSVYHNAHHEISTQMAIYITVCCYLLKTWYNVGVWKFIHPTSVFNTAWFWGLGFRPFDIDSAEERVRITTDPTLPIR